MNKAFWEIASSAVLGESNKDGKRRIEYDANVFPQSGMVTNGAAPTKQLTAIYFSGDELGADVLRVKPNYSVIADGNKMDGSGTDTPAIKYQSVTKPDHQVYMETTTPDHPHFAAIPVTAPPVTSHPTPPPVVTPQPPVPPGGTGQMLANKTLKWPATQDLWDFVMGGLDSQPFDFVVGGNKKTGTIKAIEYGAPPIMRKLMLWDIDAGDVGIYGTDPNEPLGTRPDVSFVVDGPAPAGGIALRRGGHYRGVWENHGDASQPGSCRMEILTY